MATSLSTVPTAQLGTTDMAITRVGFGAWALGGADWAAGWGAQDDADSIAAIRRALDQWLEKNEVHPVMIGEFEDYAMLREFARAGHGFAPVPAVLEEQFRRQYGFASIGTATGVRAEFYAISVERKIKHPAIAAMTDNARRVFAEVA